MDAAPDFATLTPDTAIEAVETALGARCSNLCRPLTSYINRVYEIGLADGGGVIAKFYRPGRWSRAALEDEMEFLAELAAEDIPVVPPLPGSDGTRLHARGGLHYAVFPKRGGRPLEEPTPDLWQQLGRLLGRLHVVGARHPPRDRIVLDPRHAGQANLRAILDAGVVAPAARTAYAEAATSILDTIAPLFDDVETLRIHGDCHRGNILHRPGEGYHLLDFDDMALGPAVQDLWLLLPDRLRACQAEMGDLLEGYETFRTFPHGELRLIEPLRALRFLHYTAWCARQKADGGFARLAPDWGSAAFWRQETAALRQQHEQIREALAG